MNFCGKRKNVNISETVRDSDLDRIFDPQGMERVFYVKLKNFNFATFGGHLGFLRKTENVNISETARDSDFNRIFDP